MQEDHPLHPHGRLQRAHVFVTGGAKGIGAAVVEKALAEGAYVSLIDVDAAAVSAFIAAHQNSAARLSAHVGDIRFADAIAKAHQAARDKFGPVRGLVNNAGRNSYADPVTMSEAEWDDVFSVDLKSAFLCVRQMLPDMIAAKAGSIVNIASIHADMTFPGMFPYAAAKSGLVGMTRSLALDVGRHNIRVNALSPGYTLTPLLQDYFTRQPKDEWDKVIAVHPMGRIASPAEIANCIVFLLGDEASFVTGANWRVDGGLGARFA